jgi:23S rRNA (pseudouridine1915-N3)-methyltransferase
MIRIVAVGKLKDARLAGVVADYLRRCRPLHLVEMVEVRDSEPEREARELVDRLGSPRSNEFVVALDEHGAEITSEELADLLGSHGAVAFLIGGPDGLGSAARQRAAVTLRLSALTLPHELARVVLAEQIYRGLTILRGGPYHRA